MQHQIAGGGVTNTDMTSPSSGDFADAGVWKFQVKVSHSGKCEWRACDLSAGGSMKSLPGGHVSDLQLSNGEYTPFIHIVQATTSPTPVILHSIHITKKDAATPTDVDTDAAKKIEGASDAGVQRAGTTDPYSGGAVPQDLLIF